jgi:hypothetical protein
MSFLQTVNNDSSSSGTRIQYTILKNKEPVQKYLCTHFSTWNEELPVAGKRWNTKILKLCNATYTHTCTRSHTKFTTGHVQYNSLILHAKALFYILTP